jgi:hypothetical protein
VTEPFVWTVFRNRYATEGAAFVSESWEDYVETNAAIAETVAEKRYAPGIIHGDCGGSRLKVNVKTACALVIDSDEVLLAEDEIDALLEPFAGVRHFFSWRRGKFHLVLPLAEPITDPSEIRDRRECALTYFARTLGRPLDMTAARPASLLHPYTRLPDMTADESVVVRYGAVDAGRLDLNELLAREGYRQKSPRLSRAPHSSKQSSEWTTTVEKALVERNCFYPDAKITTAADGARRRAICCPFHPEDSKGPGDTSTILFVDSGWIYCAHNRCAWRSQPEFLRELGIRDGDLPPYVTALLEESATPRVSLDEASRRIRLALMGARPYDRTATVVRVTTGAGKTRAAAEFLDGYCSPRWDAETGDVIAGRSAFLATPTNALMREVSERIGVEHGTAVGTLAVLDSVTGEPACRKWAVAKELQASGGDVHRLMCAGCEFAAAPAGCPALSGRVTGDGALTVTNHALLPSLVRKAVEGGRTPLIVWDESPQLIELRRFTFSDLEWMLDRFDLEDDPRRGLTLARLAEVSLFGDRYRVAMRPLIEVLRRLRGGESLDEAVSAYGATRLAESQLTRAESLLGLPVGAGTTWDRIRASARAARRVNVADMSFDAMSAGNRALVLRAESLHGAVIAVTEDGARVFPQPGAIEVAYLTENGRLWREFGGVVLDATAPVHDLLAVRADAEVVDIAVEDAEESVRAFYFTPGIGRRTLGGLDPIRRAEIFARIGKEVARNSVRFEKNVGRKPRVLVLSYKTYLGEIEGAVEGAETHYFGNTRGYDGWYQRGFDFFVTIGDPYANIVSEDRAYDTLGITSVSIDDYCAYRARSEAAQAHGRGRDPVAKKADGARIHLHFGRLPPLGWALDNVVVRGLE